MVLQRKPSLSKKQDVDSFISSAPGKTIEKTDNKFGKKVISISLYDNESDWIDNTVKELNKRTARRITRTEIISAAVGLLKTKTIDEILQVIQTR